MHMWESDGQGLINKNVLSYCGVYTNLFTVLVKGSK